MTKKELCEMYIEANLELNDKENNLSEAFSAFNYDNSIISVIPDRYRDLLNNLFIVAVGESNADWTDYWLYECKAKTETIIGIDGKDYVVTTFDELWALVGED